jgi:hypothetical protein
MRAGLLLALVLLWAPVGATTDIRPTRAEGVQAWRAIESVITHPRCVNCHTASEYPRQGDERRRHDFRVLRGHEGKGTPGALCVSCHAGVNNAASGTPGGPHWHLAPLGMAWESAPGRVMKGAQLCSAFKNTARNGGHTPQKMVEHHASEPLVLWAWTPGVRADGSARAVPPITHAQLLQATERWAAAGAPCPQR